MNYKKILIFITFAILVAILYFFGIKPKNVSLPLLPLLGLEYDLHWSKNYNETIATNANKENYDKGTLNGSIYNILTELKEAKTTLEKQEIIKKYVGLKINDNGFVSNISISKNEFLNLNTYHLSITQSKDKQSLNDTIWCTFDNSWEQQLKILDTEKKISFSGTISESIFGMLDLNDCKLE